MIDKERAYKIADKYLIEYVGNLICPGEPIFDGKIDSWIIPVFHKSKVATFPVGNMIVDSKGSILHVPNFDESKEIIDKKFQSGLD